MRHEMKNGPTGGVGPRFGFSSFCFRRIQFTPETPLCNREVDLGDELLAQIMDLVRNADLPVHRKAKSLVRAGKIGEMYL